MARKTRLTAQTRYSLVVIGVIVLALVFGYLGAGLRVEGQRQPPPGPR